MQNGCITRPVQELQNRHKGQDIYLIAGGKSLDYLDLNFFVNKVTVGLNHAYCRFKTSYMVVRDNNFFEDVYAASVEQDAKLIAARMGFLGPVKRVENTPKSENKRMHYTFETEWAGPDGLDLNVIGSDQMIAGMSSVTTALHVCAYLGASNVILCGVDGGRLDGEKYFAGYRDGTAPNVGESAFVRWLGSVEKQIVQVRDRMREVYGCNVVSLNPFINFGLEGHSYEHA